MLERAIICTNCNFIRNIHEYFLDLSMNLAGANGSKLTNVEKVRLEDCITDFFKTENLDKDNLLFCENCQIKSTAQMRFRMKQLPQILICHFKRFSWTG